MYYKDELNIKIYNLDIEEFGVPMNICTINDSFICKCLLQKDEPHTVFNYFPIQLNYMIRLTNKLNMILDIDHIIKKLNSILYFSRTDELLADLKIFCNSNLIPFIILDKKFICNNNTFYDKVYTLSFSWFFARLCKIGFEKKCFQIWIEHEYVNFLEGYDNLRIARCKHNISKEKDLDDMINFSRIIFNLKRKDMKYVL